MGEPRWLDDDQQQAWRKLVAVVTRLPSALDAQLQRDSGLTHFGYWVLVHLSDAPDRTLRLSHLAAQANSSLSRLSHVLTRLENLGLIRRERAGRANVAVLTDTGCDQLAAAAPGHVETVRSLVFDGLDTGQVRRLDEVCAALLAQLDPAAPGGRVRVDG
jgi:DNA-binding MarR family transcriptional regulator